jgi:hypothetical protein
MPKHAVALAAVTLLLSACGDSGPTDPGGRDLAPSFAVTELGTPGDANCRGQTSAYLAQVAKNRGVEGFRGIGGIARFEEVPVREVHAAIEAFCAGL